MMRKSQKQRESEALEVNNRDDHLHSNEKRGDSQPPPPPPPFYHRCKPFPPSHTVRGHLEIVKTIANRSRAIGTVVVERSSSSSSKVMRSVRRKRITGRAERVEEDRVRRERRAEAGESEGRTYRIRVYAPKRGRPRRGSRSALTYCSTFVAESSLPPNFVANPETQNAAPTPFAAPLEQALSPSLSLSFSSSSSPPLPCNLADLKLNPLYRGIGGGAAIRVHRIAAMLSFSSLFFSFLSSLSFSFPVHKRGGSFGDSGASLQAFRRFSFV